MTLSCQHHHREISHSPIQSQVVTRYSPVCRWALWILEETRFNRRAKLNLRYQFHYMVCILLSLFFVHPDDPVKYLPMNLKITINNPNSLATDAIEILLETELTWYLCPNPRHCLGGERYKWKSYARLEGRAPHSIWIDTDCIVRGQQVACFPDPFLWMGLSEKRQATLLPKARSIIVSIPTLPSQTEQQT